VTLTNLAHQAGRDFESSQIHAFEFHEPTRKLFVQFRSNGARITYAYANITPEEAALLDLADSKGQHLNRKWTAAHTDFERLPGYEGDAAAAGAEAA
jgi:hypothetical protein